MKIVRLSVILIMLLCCLAEAGGTSDGSVLPVAKQLDKEDAQGMLVALKDGGIAPAALVGDEALRKYWAQCSR